jgi:adenosylmethionine-8-amino-7-oxononanoate aminotransferase
MRYLHPLAVKLAERLVASLPPGLDTVFFVNSGSEATKLSSFEHPPTPFPI